MANMPSVEHSFPSLMSGTEKLKGKGLAKTAQLIYQPILKLGTAKLSMHDHAKSKLTKAHILAKQHLVLLSSSNTASQPKEIKICYLLLSISHFSNENVIMFNKSNRKPRDRRKE